MSLDVFVLLCMTKHKTRAVDAETAALIFIIKLSNFSFLVDMAQLGCIWVIPGNFSNGGVASEK